MRLTNYGLPVRLRCCSEEDAAASNYEVRQEAPGLHCLHLWFSKHLTRPPTSLTRSHSSHQAWLAGLHHCLTTFLCIVLKQQHYIVAGSDETAHFLMGPALCWSDKQCGKTWAYHVPARAS